jgi:hypothetical protein
VAAGPPSIARHSCAAGAVSIVTGRSFRLLGLRTTSTRRSGGSDARFFGGGFDLRPGGAVDIFFPGGFDVMKGAVARGLCRS